MWSLPQETNFSNTTCISQDALLHSLYEFLGPTVDKVITNFSLALVQTPFLIEIEIQYYSV